MKRKEAPAAEPLFTEELRQALSRDGYVVVPGVLPRELCHELHEKMLDYHRVWDPRLETSNWSSALRPPGPHGLNQFSAHQDFCWEVRQHPRVVQVFAELHQEPRLENMLCSFDGFRFLSHLGTYIPGFWAHTDQGKNVHAQLPFCCVQGSVAVTDSDDPLDGDLVVWRGGHRAHAGYFRKFPDAVKSGVNWYKYPQWYLDEIAQDGRAWLAPCDPEAGRPEPFPMPRIRVQRKAGDLVLWYSATPHQSDPPKRGAPHDATAIFVCMAPRKYASPKDLEKLRKSFEQGRTTAHWPVRYIHVFGTPRTHSDEGHDRFKVRRQALLQARPNVTKDQLTPLGRRLVGYEQ
jgi:hypothetical protein